MSAHKSAWTRLVAAILFPLHERLKGHSSVQPLARTRGEPMVEPRADRG